ncbi:unnamed protein product, partial [Sphacelaria rigidula]
MAGKRALLVDLLDGGCPRDRKLVSQAFLSHTDHTLSGRRESSVPHLVDTIAGVLDKEHIGTFYDAENLRQVVGRPWKPKIVKEVKRSTVFVAILTPAFSQRFWPMYELHLAIEAAEQQPQYRRHLVPVLYGTDFVELH